MACKKTYTLNEVLDFILNDEGQISEGDSNIALLPPTERYGEESAISTIHLSVYRVPPHLCQAFSQTVKPDHLVLTHCVQVKVTRE